MVEPQHVAWLNDPGIVQYSEQRHKSHTERTQQIYLNSFGAGGHIWLIRDKDRDIGTITAYISAPNKIADMGILIGERTAWGQGYGTEAWKCVMDWCFNDERMRKIECGTMLDNHAMRRIAVKNKMKCEAVRIQHFWLNDAPQDLLLYGRLRL